MRRVLERDPGIGETGLEPSEVVAPTARQADGAMLACKAITIAR